MTTIRSALILAATAALIAGACGGKSSSSACTDPLMIDDMEDNDRFICESGGRNGAWYTLDDGTSTNISPSGDFTQSSIPGGRGESRYAAHFTGFDFTDWGAAMGFSLNDQGATAQPFDASTTSGVRFWMKTNVPVNVAFPIPETVSAASASGACLDDATTWNCDNHFQFTIASPKPDEWMEYDVPYAALTQRGIIGPEGTLRGSASWNPSRLVNVQFNVNRFQTFDLWIDDVRFYSCAANECVPTCTDPGLPVACPAAGSAPAACLAAGTICPEALAANLTGVWGFAADDVWAGGGGTFLHWNGSAWSTVPSGTTEMPSIRWGSAPDDIWAVGAHGTILHWNGSVWSATPSGTDNDIFGVWGSGRDDVWAVGGLGTILHWDGSSWSPVTSGTTYRLWRAWGSGPTDVWAAGTSETSTAGILVHWDGMTWSTTGSDTPALMGIWGSAFNDIWAVGLAGNILHWNGTVWSLVPSGTSKQLLTVGGSGPNDVWALGVEGTLLHWEGSGWTPVPNGSSVNLLGVWARTSSDAWIVGPQGTILHWDGAAWSAVPVAVQ